MVAEMNIEQNRSQGMQTRRKASGVFVKMLRHISPAIVTIGLIGSAGIATADTFTFIGGGSTSNWSDAANWFGGLIPTNDGTADVILSSSASTSNVDVAWQINSITQGSGAAYTLNTTGTVQLKVKTSLDNASSSALSIAGKVAAVSGKALNFNSGTFRVTGTVSSGVNVIVLPAANLYVSSSGTVSSAFGNIGVGQAGGLLGGAGTLSSGPSGMVAVNSPDGGFLPGPTLFVGDPLVNSGVGTLVINSPSLAIGQKCFIDFTFDGADHSLITASGAISLSSGNIFNIFSVDDPTAPGVYSLINYNGTAIAQSVLSSQTLNLPSGWDGSLVSTNGALALNLTAVPEPQTWVMITLGLAGLASMTRRKRMPSA
jgi:PEP-CTERM motif